MIAERGAWSRRCGLMFVALVAMVLAADGGSAAGRSHSGVSPRAAVAESAATPVIESVPSPPRWFAGDDGRVHVDYELLLTNASSVSVRVASLEVLSGGGARISRLSGQRLTAAMGWPGVNGTTTELGPFSVGIVWLDLTLANLHALPRWVQHRLTVNLPPGLGVPSVITETGERVAIAHHTATVIAPPLRGGRWALVSSVHRRSLLPVNGGLHNAQRFAVDFSALLDARSRTHVGNADRNASYFNYGQPVVAVGAGTVVEAVDRYPDQIPNHNHPVGLAAADGNHVIIKLARGVFAGYAHLKPGSVRVHIGERVYTGQVLGLLGNSGNTSGPHLHFQLMTRPSLLDADGLPFVIGRFRLDGRMPSLEALIDADLAGTRVPIDRSMAGTHRRQGFTDLDVATFSRG
ncbi:MAG: M23 family metallopeptidase [Solirubrobacteraceae bacterium]